MAHKLYKNVGGEATFGGDEFQRPTDYLRESLDSIEQAWIEAGLKQAALAEPQPEATLHEGKRNEQI